jgi:hypothetical protein
VKEGVQNLFPPLWQHHASSFNDCFGFRTYKIPLLSKWDFIRHKDWKYPWSNNIFKWYGLQAFFSFKHRTHMLVSSSGCTRSIINSLQIWPCYNGLSNVHKMGGGCCLRSCRTHRVNWGSLKRRMKEGNNKFSNMSKFNNQDVTLLYICTMAKSCDPHEGLESLFWHHVWYSTYSIHYAIPCTQPNVIFGENSKNQ